MEYEKIEQRVVDLLEISAVEREGEEHSLWLALYHMLMTVSIMDKMNDMEKAQVIRMKKHFEFFFSTNFNLKNRARKEKKKASPHTPYKDKKAEKEREIKGESSGEAVLDFKDDDLNARKEAFWVELLKREGLYGREMLQDFFDHWGEESRTKGVLLFEKRTHWNLDSRLRKWSRNSQTLANAEAAERLKKQKKGDVESRSKERRIKEQAAQREEANARLEAEIEERKAGAVSREEWLAMKAKKTTD